MFKRLLPILNGADAGPNGVQHSSDAAARHAIQGKNPGSGDSLTANLHSCRTQCAEKQRSFDEIYKAAPAQPPQITYGILKLAEMLNSSHLAGMSHDGKRCSVMMAIEAAGVAVDDLLQDAMLRQRALNDYEAAAEQRLKDFENVIEAENARLHAELEGLTAQYMARVQANIDEMATAQDDFRAWQKSKRQELQRISTAAEICVPKGVETSGNASYSSVLARVTVEQAVGAR